MKILFLTHHWNTNTHHSKFSGYQQLVLFASRENDCTVVTWGTENTIKYENGICVHYVKPLINRDYFFSKRFAISKYASKIESQFDVVHSLYTDCGYYQDHPKFFATLHISPSNCPGYSFKSRIFLYLKRIIIERRVFNKCKAIIVVSNNLSKELVKYGKKAIFIPHGINTEFWKPTNDHESMMKNSFVLSVGNNGVNKSILRQTFEENPQIKFVVVGLRDFKCNLPNVKQYCRITDNELKKLYSDCSFFIRPMNFATANNSVLEALAIGKPALISTPDGAYDYFVNNIPFIQIVKNIDFSESFKIYFNYLKNDSILCASDIRNYVKANFDWEIIWNRTKELYGSQA